MQKEKPYAKTGLNSLIAGIIGLVCLFISWFSLASIILGIIAVYEGNKVRKSGDKYGQIGFLLGIIQIALWAVFLIASIFVYAYITEII